MRKLVLLALIIAVFWQWCEGKLPGFSTPGAFDEAGQPIVLVFTTADCGAPCSSVMRELKRREVPSEKLLISFANQEDENFSKWKKMGRNAIPLTVAGYEKVAGFSKPQLATLLGKNFSEEYLTGAEKRYFKKHFYADGSPRIVMYGVDWCPYCTKLRKEFEENGIDFVEIDVEKSGEKEKMCRVMGIGGYPATWVGYTRVNGTTLRAVKKVLNRS